MSGCSTLQLDTLAECSVDIIVFAGVKLWSDINCTDRTFEGFRIDQTNLIEALRVDLSVQEEILDEIKDLPGGTPPPTKE